MSTPLNERAQTLLKLLIEKHIEEGQAIGSKTLAEEGQLGLSSASIRNILADLENRGYLIAPHTSSGRIPTELGYRFFVNALLTIKPISPTVIQEYQKQFSAEQDIQGLLSKATTLLSNFSDMVSLITLPKQDHLRITHIEFLPLSGSKVLVILVFNDMEIQNRVIQMEREYTREELQFASNFLCHEFSGRDFHSVRHALYQTIQNEKHHMDTLMEKALALASKALSKEENSDYLLAGQGRLIEQADQHNLENLKQLFQAFTQKQEILHLLDRCINAQGVQIFIGSESKHRALGEYSLITASYQLDEQPIGVLGIIGPTRMPYDKIIPIVDSTAKMLTITLNQQKSSPKS